MSLLPTIPAHKERDQKEIEESIKEFQSRGGKITVIIQGQTGFGGASHKQMSEQKWASLSKGGNTSAQVRRGKKKG